MFKSITWGQYSLVLLLLLALYYAYVGAMYYRLELLGLFKGRMQRPSPAPAPKPAVAALVGKSSLVGRPGATPAKPMPAAPEPVAEPTEQPAEEASVATAPEEQQPAEQEVLTPELPELDLPTAEVKSDFKDEIGTEVGMFDDKVINFTQQTSPETFQEAVSGVEAAPEAFEPDYTMDVAQLGDYFERAAEGQLTPAQLVEQAPALDNTELLAAFFKTNTQAAQQLTSQVYADVAEPGLD